MNDTDFKRAVLDQLATLAAEHLALRKNIDRWRAETKAALQVREGVQRDGAVKRAVAAKMMSMGATKLDALIKAGSIHTAEDRRLVPISEIRRYCAPKVKRERRPSVGHRARMKRVDGTSDEALELATKAIRERARGANR